MLSFKKALGVACIIIVCMATFIIGSEVAFGIRSAGLLTLVISIFLGIGGVPPTKKELMSCLLGTFYGFVFGQCFGFFKPLFLLAILILIAMRIANKGSIVFNDYALTVISVYTLASVANIQTAWQDIIVFLISFALLFLFCTIIEKKVFVPLDFSDQKLSTEDEAKPYSKYFHQDIQQPDPTVRKAVMSWISPAKAMPITDINSLCHKENAYNGCGCCIMPDGTGYVAVRQFMPGVTKEMEEWWGEWHPQENLRYQLWFRPGHKSIQILNPEEPLSITAMPERIAGRSLMGRKLHMIEDCGLGNEHVEIHFLTPEEMGFDIQQMKNSDIVHICGGNGRSWGQEENSPISNAVVCHVYYEAEGGLIVQSHFWLGWTFENGEAHPTIPRGSKIPAFGPMALADHCVREFANLGAILPEIYREEAGNTEKA